MFFTYEDYKKIEEWLKHRAVKDSQFEEADSLNTCDKIPIVQDGENKTIHVCDLIKEIEKQSTTTDDMLNELLYNIKFGNNSYYDTESGYVHEVSLNYNLSSADTVTYSLPVSVTKHGVKLKSVDEGGDLYGISSDPTVPDKTDNDISISQTFNKGEVPSKFEMKAYVKIWPLGKEENEIIVEVKRTCAGTAFPYVKHVSWLNESGTMSNIQSKYVHTPRTYNYNSQTVIYQPNIVSKYGDYFEIYVAGDKGSGNAVVQTMNNGAYEASCQGTVKAASVDANYVGTEKVFTKYILGDSDNPLHLDSVTDLGLLITI